MKEKALFRILGMGLVLAVAGCESVPSSLAPAERAMKSFDVAGIKLGDKPDALAIFPQVRKVPIKIEGMDVYEIYNPTDQISMILASFYDDSLRKLEIRYFNGEGVRTLGEAGGWDGIRDYLVEKFGPPSRFGSEVPVVARQPGLNVKYAQFNGEWSFSRIRRQLNYIAMSDASGGVGVVNVMDTTPIPQPAPAANAMATSTAPRTRVVTGEQ